MLNAVSAEAVRIQNGSNHQLLKFALICSLMVIGPCPRRLVSILSCAISSGLSCIVRVSPSLEYTAQYLTPTVLLIQTTYLTQPSILLTRSNKVTKTPKTRLTAKIKAAARGSAVAP